MYIKLDDPRKIFEATLFHFFGYTKYGGRRFLADTLLLESKLPVGRMIIPLLASCGEVCCDNVHLNHVLEMTRSSNKIVPYSILVNYVDFHNSCHTERKRGSKARAHAAGKMVL